MTGDPYFRTVDVKPPLGVPVRLFWSSRGPFEATRVCRQWFDSKPRPYLDLFLRWQKRQNRKIGLVDDVWLAAGDDGAVLLPDDSPPVDRARPWIGFGGLSVDGPEFWHHPNAHKWQILLPEPAFVYDPTTETRLWHERASFNAAEAAAEMEADRETARVQRDPSEKRANRLALQYWRNHVGIRYESPEVLTLKMAEWRVCRALALSEPFKGYGSKYPRVSRTLAELAMTQADIRLRAENTPPDNELGVPLEPQPQDDGDFLIAMGWFVALNPPPSERSESWSLSPKQKVLAWRALPMPLSFRECGDRLPAKVKAERARQIYSEAIEAIWRIGAGLDKSPAMDRIEELRERNRAFKRNQQMVVL